MIIRLIFFFIAFVSSLLISSDLLQAFPDESSIRSLQGQVRAFEKTVQSLRTEMETLKSTVRSQRQLIEDQGVRLQVLEEAARPSRAQGAAIPQPEGALALAGRSQGFNPDIGVVGTAQAHLTENSEDAEGQDTVALRELEVNFAQYVDPYSRFDAVIDFNDNLERQNVDIEEAYYTHWALPLEFKGQLGKFRSRIGKQNLLHVEQLETVDYPLVIRDFFGEEGFSSSGLRLQHFIPNPWEVPLEWTGEVLRGNNGVLFSGVSRRPIFNTHLKSFFEISKEANLELGATALFGDENPPRLVTVADNLAPVRDPKGQDRYGVQVLGLDATYLWNLPEGRTVKFQNEAYLARKSSVVSVNQNPWGFYSLLDYRFSRRWSAGVRLDYLEPRAVRDFHEYSLAVSPYLTLWQSEFANFRLQYRHQDSADPAQKSDDAVFLQANFAIGSHRHPVP